MKRDQESKRKSKSLDDRRDGKKEMLFSFKNKYHYTYPNTYIALYFSYAKVTCNTHTKKQEIVSIPLTLVPSLA